MRAEPASVRPLRVLFMAWRDLAHPLAGGSEVLVDHLATGLVERGHHVQLLCGGPAGARPYAVTSTGGTYSQYLLSPLHYLTHARDFDLVVDVANGLPFFSPTWRRGPTICLVNHLHRDQWALWFPRPLAALGRGLESRAMPLLYRRPLFMAVSNSTADALTSVGVAPEHITIVHNGVDAVAHDPTKAADPLFVAIGRLVPHKRFDLLLRLWDRVRPLTGGSLVIAGEGPERVRLEAMAGPGASLAGWLSQRDKGELLDAAWLLLHPAMVEGWGLVVMEAAARRTPTLAFDSPGLRDSILDRETGLLANSEDDLARAWVALSGDKSWRESLGTAARARASLFSWTATVDAFLELAATTIARGAARRSRR
jgi:glycosyltransferase involved in cell wall biosynthesis